MGRVYDALKRASAGGQGSGGAGSKKKDTEKRREGTTSAAGRQLAAGLPQKNGEEHPWDNSPLFSATAHESASTAHTEELAGSALSGVGASRAAGATLDAAGTARARPEFMSLDISAARVEPH